MHFWTAVRRPLTSSARSKETTDEHFRRLSGVWWAWLDFNQRPHPYQVSRAKRCADRPFPRSPWERQGRRDAFLAISSQAVQAKPCRQSRPQHGWSQIMAARPKSNSACRSVTGGHQPPASRAQGQADAAWLLVRHAVGEELDQLGRCRRVEVAQADHHVAELGEETQLTVHAGRPAAVPVAAQRSLALH